MSFSLDKKNSMEKLDKSRKGDVDEHIKELVDSINELPNYYTSSSCSGRIMLMTMGSLGRKYESEWFFVSHDPVDASLIELENLPKETLWLRQEPVILHVCCKTVEDAKKLLSVTANTSFKYSGIVSLSKKIVIQIMGVDKMDVPVAKDGELLISREYFDYLVSEANKKLEMNFERINKLSRLLVALKS